MRRLPVAAFAALAVLTVAAFFVTQHLKVSTPLVSGDPRPVPATINPVSGGVCKYPSGKYHVLKPISFRRMRISFYLHHRSDDIDLWIVKPNGEIIDQIADDVHMVGGRHPARGHFSWDGRTSAGTIAPDGVYNIRITLLHQSRTLLLQSISGTPLTVTVLTQAPKLRVLSVTGPDGSRPAVIADPGTSGDEATIHYAGAGRQRPQILIYRSEASGRLRLLKSYFATTASGTSAWNGTLRNQVPAPQGAYLIGLKLIDHACTKVVWPASPHPTPASTLAAGVTVR